MPIPLKRNQLILIISISVIMTLISAIFVIAQQNELYLEEAMDNGQVTVNIRGNTNGQEFQQPMLQVTLTPQTYWPTRIVFPPKLMLKPVTSEQKADVITLQSKKITLFGFTRTTTLFAYSLDYNQLFPDSDSEYELKENPTISPQLNRVLDNIVARKYESKQVSQLAVWSVYQKKELKTIENDLNDGLSEPLDFSIYNSEFNEIVNKQLRPAESTSYSWLWWVALIVFFLLTFISGIQLIYALYIDQPSDKLIAHLSGWKRHDKGGMAEVWIAYDKRQTPHQKFIVKFPNINIDPDLIKYRFKTEIGEHQKLKHLNIVQFIESGEWTYPNSKQKTDYIILEFIDGCTIKQLLKKRNFNPLPDQVMFNIVHQLLMALDYLHAKEIIHRDLSWSNIMIAKTTGNVYIIDFGNATRFYSDSTEQEGLPPVNTPQFNVPIDIGNVPGRDFYALAVLIYAMCGGRDIRVLKLSEITTGINQLEKMHDYPTWVRGILEWYLHGEYKKLDKLKNDLSFAPRHELAQLVEETMNQEGVSAR